ncbi:MAG: sigma-70 family RNA polymerase sigma factor [Alistipes sp.]|nr:sigma-70 family RNA polymerase sigma factor [Alistipes sp.]MDE6779237.1 sigma-70 family RNA polymerase sigma factor [Alistipes sp.]
MTPTTEPAIAARQDELIARTYEKMRDAIRGYILKRIGNAADSEDLAQDVFVRMLECNTLLTEQTLLNFTYTIARNHVIDYLRRHARSRRAAEYFSCRAAASVRNTEERIAADELERLEEESIARMSPRKAEIYVLYVHENRSVDDISGSLGLSRRTVENHIFAARQDLRSALRCAL